MALTEINSKSIKNSDIINEDIADDTIAEVKLDISNAPSDGKFLKYKDSTDKLTWDDVPAGVGGANAVAFNDGVTSTWGADSDIVIKEDSGGGFITGATGTTLNLGVGSSNSILALTGTGVSLKLGTTLTNSADLIFANPNSEIRFKEDPSNGSLYVGFKAPAQVTADSIWALPGADGSAGQVLKTDGSKNLSWTDAGSGATGGGTEKIFWENGTTIDQDYTVGTSFGAACNAMSAGPITINTGKTVTVDAGDTWTIV